MKFELEKLFGLLEKRLTQHDNNRKDIQSKIQEICSRVIDETDSLEERIDSEIHAAFDPIEESILGLIEDFNNVLFNQGEDMNVLIERTKQVLSSEKRCKIDCSKKADNFVDSYRLIVFPAKADKKSIPDINNKNDNNENVIMAIINHLKEHLNKSRECMTAAQDTISEICTRRRNEAKDLEVRINKKMEEPFAQEDARLQEVVKLIKEKIDNGSSDDDDDDDDELRHLIREAKNTLLIIQEYAFSDPSEKCPLGKYDLTITKDIYFEDSNFKEASPKIVSLIVTDNGEVVVSFAFFSINELNVLGQLDISLNVEVKTWRKDCESTTLKNHTAKYIVNNGAQICVNSVFPSNATYCLSMRIKHRGSYSEWSDTSEFTTPKFSECVWKECPDYVFEERRYSVDEKNPRIATKIDDDKWCTVIGNVLLPVEEVASWDIKVVNSKNNDGGNILVGVAPFDIDQNGWDNSDKCGWYLHCYDSALWSGPPHDIYAEYGPRKEPGKYVRNGGSVGVVMDTTNGELSFIVNDANHGAAIEGIPLDKPLVPCVILWYKNDCVELINIT